MLEDENQIQSEEQESLPTTAEETSEEKLEREKSNLLSKLAADSLTDIKSKVAFILNHHPNTRNDDVALTIQYWRVFDDDILGGEEFISVKDIYKLTRTNSIIRARAKIQNTYGLFLAAESVRRRRAELDEGERERQGEDQPDIPSVSIFCDESGKTDNNLLVGSVWINDPYKVYQIYKSLTAWKKEKEIPYEFHFSALSRHKVPDTLGFVQKAMSESDALAFKIAIVNRRDIGSLGVEEAIYKLHYQLVVQGMEHEVTSGRLSLPRLVSVTKDKDDGSDRLQLVDLKRKLKRECSEHFTQGVTIDAIESEDSSSSIFLQLSDLFTGAVSRVINRVSDASRNHKDEFADELLRLLGINAELDVDAVKQDFVKIIKI